MTIVSSPQRATDYTKSTYAVVPIKLVIICFICLSQPCKSFSLIRPKPSILLSHDQNNKCASHKQLISAENDENHNHDLRNKPLINGRKQDRTICLHKLRAAAGVTSTISLAILSTAVLTIPFKTAIAATRTTIATNPLCITSGPLLPVIIACTIPSLLGYYKSEYGVSYAYGLAMASSSLIALSRYPHITLSTATTPQIHALTTLFYGTRLTLFLLYRELVIPRFRTFRDRIEKKAKERGGRVQRTPFILTCAALYACLAAPLFLLSPSSAYDMTTPGLANGLYKTFVGLSLGGFLLNAVGDVTKTLCKRKDEDALVTSGVFALFRHPNYTGEQVGWTFNFLAGVASIFVAATGSKVKSVVVNPLVWASFFGWLGIEFVLCAATTTLEHRQKTSYGERPEYHDWVQRTWAGFKL